jgi:hypothetical protein
MPRNEVKSAPREILKLIEKPPLLKGESRRAYLDLFWRVSTELEPIDTIDWLFVIQFVECIWEAQRLRRFKALHIQLGEKRALLSVITQMVYNGRGPSDKIIAEAERWSANPDHFVKHGLDPECVAARAVVLAAGSLEQLDRMIERAERRADVVLGQLSLRRDVFAHRARQAAPKMIEVERTQGPLVTSNEVPLTLAPSGETASKMDQGLRPSDNERELPPSHRQEQLPPQPVIESGPVLRLE